MPKEKQYFLTREQLMARLEVNMGGRAAEEALFGIRWERLIFGSDTIPAAALSDLQVKSQDIFLWAK